MQMSDCPSLPEVVFHFESYPGNCSYQGMTSNLQFVGYAKPLKKMIASDSLKIIAFDTSDGSMTVLWETSISHRVCCIHPITGDIVFATEAWNEDIQDYLSDFFRFEIQNAKAVPIELPSSVGPPLWGLRPERIIELANGERVYLGLISSDGEDHILAFSHVDASGDIIYSDLVDDNCHITDPYSVCDGLGLYSTDQYCIYAWRFETYEATLLAGSEYVWGCRDGAGWNARFWRLRKPISNGRYLFVRTEGPREWQWRQVRVNLQTMHAQTVKFDGVDHDEMCSYFATDTDLFCLQGKVGEDSECISLQFLRAAVEPAEDPPAFSTCLASVDLNEPVHPITFKLANGSALQVDTRLLTARSAYFRDMLSSGLQEARRSEVDLTHDRDADATSVGVVLHFVLGDTWNAPRDDADLAFRVRALADRYRLSKLVRLAETILYRMLEPDTVLMFLGRLVGSGSALEEACWALMESDRNVILRRCENDIGELIRQNPELAKRLILWQTGAVIDPALSRHKRRKLL